MIQRAAELHDIGKIAIPEEILRKPGPLDRTEWELMRRHTLIGERILDTAPALRPVARIVRSSHEWWDGSGYPDGVAGEEIPLGARIIFVCDAFDAMTSLRPYAPAVSEERRSPSCGGRPACSSIQSSSSCSRSSEPPSRIGAPTPAAAARALVPGVNPTRAGQDSPDPVRVA